MTVLLVVCMCACFKNIFFLLMATSKIVVSYGRFQTIFGGQHGSTRSKTCKCHGGEMVFCLVNVRGDGYTFIRSPSHRARALEAAIILGGGRKK